MTVRLQNKKILIITGPNGAGKTTFARSFLPAEAACPRFINADLIAAGLSPFAPEAAAIKAGRLMLEEIRSCVQRGESFAFETILSGLGYLRHIREWREKGYRVSLYFLSLPDVGFAVARVAGRVRQGGHAIPEAVIRRRFAAGFAAGLRNFERHYRASVNDWTLYDNTGIKPALLEWGSQHMNPKDISTAENPDLRASFVAMQRAAELARKIAIQTETGIVITKDGKLAYISADELRKEAAKEKTHERPRSTPHHSSKELRSSRCERQHSFKPNPLRG
jgi:predicted ABC-type ATPase